MNLLVLPGSGHFYLKKKKRGLIFSLLVFTILFFFTFHLISIIASHATELQSIKANNPNALFKQADHLSKNMLEIYGSTLGTYIYALIAVYIGSLIDVIWLYFSENSKSSSHTP